MGYKHGGLELAHGNTKLGKDTLIFNMGSAMRCPSKQKGLCKLGNKCYAAKAERMYKNTLAYRHRQEDYWKATSANTFEYHINQILNKHKRATRNVKYLRINESGDFWTQDCVEKLDKIATRLDRNYHITTYTYSARSDLDFSSASFMVKGSSNTAGNNGMTIVRNNRKIKANQKLYKGIVNTKIYWEKICGKKRKFFICPTTCESCMICKHWGTANVVFAQH